MSLDAAPPDAPPTARKAPQGPLTPAPEAPGPAIRADHARLGGGAGLPRLIRDALFHKTFRVLASYRLLRAARQARGLARLLAPAAALWHRHCCLSAGMEIAWQAEIGPGARILHGFGLVILPCARIGAGVTLCHGAAVGYLPRAERGESRRPDAGRPDTGQVEDGAFVGPYAMVFSRLGAGATLGAHAVLTRPGPAGAVLMGQPARVARMARPGAPAGGVGRPSAAG